MMIPLLIGTALGAGLMVAVREWEFGLYLVPIAVSIGPLMSTLGRHKPSRLFLTAYILATFALFTLIGLMSPGFRNNFDPP
jgi:hypothetical protein